MDPNSYLQQFIALLSGIPAVGPVLPYIPLICGAAAVIDASVPPPPAGSPWVLPRKVIHVLALNVGYSRNAVPAGTIPASVAAKVQEVRADVDNLQTSAATLTEVVKGNPEAVRKPL